MSRKIGSGVRSGLGRRVLRFKTDFPDATWGEVGRRFGVSADHARVSARVAEEIPASVVDSIGIYKARAIVDGKVPRNHRKAFYRLATMTEERELRRLIRKLYGDPSLREQIDEFTCIACTRSIGFDRMNTMQCVRCDEKPGLTIRFHARGELCLA